MTLVTVRLQQMSVWELATQPMKANEVSGTSSAANQFIGESDRERKTIQEVGRATRAGMTKKEKWSWSSLLLHIGSA